MLENFVSHKKYCDPSDWAISDIREGFVRHLDVVCQKTLWKVELLSILKNNIDNKDWQFLIKTIIQKGKNMQAINNGLKDVVPALLAHLDKRDLINEVEPINEIKYKKKML